MSEQIPQKRAAVHFYEEFCSNCSTCTSLCPFEAVQRNAEGHTVLDIEKCQVCGLCYASCPAHAIDILYYDIDSLTRYLNKVRKEHKSDNLAIMCKASAPDFSGIEARFGIKGFVPLSVPCVGRVPDETFMKALAMGFDNICVLACDSDFCRFERGSSVMNRKIIGLNNILEQLGYEKGSIKLQQNSLKVKVDADLCIMCANCVYYCPYNAAKLEGPGSVTFDFDLCRGCGLCVAMCPAVALDLENWEKAGISALIPQLASEMQSPKILVFRCQWAVFPSLNGDFSPHVRYIDLPCASRVDKAHILEAYLKGIDGIVIAACSEEDCKQEKASGKAQHTMETLKKTLGQIGLQNKFMFCNTSPRYPDKFAGEIEQFCQSISGAKEQI
jgi:coenzyme F420-reducing hydrogenase delta subunit/heterodisulfide reductase subunit C